ncbi:hypothetical protein B0H34DRAFT_733732 [Crassisporium funariophilum]|nr:hypothetical protein B0H34DRAFT_733732 [Crassisporium funariophilum]
MSSQALNTCAQCKTQKDVHKRCARCKAIYYCSKECQIANWKVHKSRCLSSSSDGSGSGASTTVIPRHPAAASDGRTPGVWGIRILSNDSSLPLLEKFVPEEITDPSHPIFKSGELCPATPLYGVPLMILSLNLARLGPRHNADNQPSVYLRIEPESGFAPPHWQMDYPGNCIVIRKDRKPLKKELIETMFEFHASMLRSDFFETPGAQSRITPERYQAFAENYVRKQIGLGRTGFDKMQD